MNMKMVITIIIFCVVLYALFSTVRMRRLISIGNALADSAVPYEQTPENPDYQFIAFGDSSVVGTGASSPSESTAGRLGADFPSAQITNKAVNGLKAAELVPIIQSHDGERYDLVHIQIGGNDIVRYTDLATVEESIDQILTQATEMSDNVVLLTAGNVGTAPFFPTGTRWVFTRRTRSVRSIFIAAAEKHDVHYIDLFREAADDPFADDPNKFYADDMFHPSSDGYADWYAHIQHTIQTIDI